MLDFHERRKLKSLLYTKPVAIGIAVIGLLISVSVFERYQIERDMAMRRMEKEHELMELKQRAASLEAEVRYLESERGVEEEIRDRFEVAKEGEQVIILLEGGATLEEHPAPRRNVPKDDSFFDRLIFW